MGHNDECGLRCGVACIVRCGVDGGVDPAAAGSRTLGAQPEVQIVGSGLNVASGFAVTTAQSVVRRV